MNYNEQAWITNQLEPEMTITHEAMAGNFRRFKPVVPDTFLRDYYAKNGPEMTGTEKDEWNENIIKHFNL